MTHTTAAPTAGRIAAASRLQLVLFALFAVSGFCGLIYESIWAYYLKLFVGHAAYAQTVVLVVFIGGMAIGAWLAGRFAERTRNPLLSYAIVECIVGMFAIAFQWIFTTTTDWAYASLLPRWCSADGICAPQWILAGLLILPQSILLGTTFPLMSAGIIRAFPEAPGRTLAMLYFTNSIGAVFGVLASTFVLIPAFGLPGTTTLAGSMNIALSAAVAFVAARVRMDRYGPLTGARPARISSATGAPASAAIGMLLLVAALTGLSSFIYEIVWIRMLGLVLGSSTHAFELMLSSFILGLALGGYWVKSKIDHVRDTMRFLATVQIIMGGLAFATLPVYNEMFDLMAWFLKAMARTADGYVLFNLASKLIAILVMFPATFMAGMTLPLITYQLLRSPVGERSIGYVYASNTAGAIVGVILTVHLLLPNLGLKGALVTGALIDVALGWLLFVRYRDGRDDLGYRWGWSIAGGAAALAIGTFAHLDPMKLASGVYRLGESRIEDGNEVIFHRDGKTATIDVIRSLKPTHLFIRTNGKSDAAVEMDRNDPPSVDEVTMTMTATLPLAVRPDAKTAAIIGFGSGLSTHYLLASPAIERVDTIEIEAAMVEGARLFRPRNELAYTDPRSHILIDDAKAFFARSSAKYDIIVSEPSNPWVSGVASLFSDEFYERIRHYLTDDGVLVQWIQIYEIEPDLVAAIIRALGKHFPNYEVYGADVGNLLLVSSKSGKPIALSPRVFDFPLLKADLRRLGIGHLGDLFPRRIGGSAIFKPWLTDGVLNSDYYPYVDLNAARSRFMRSDAIGLVAPRGDNIPVMELLDNKIWDSAEAPTPIARGASFRHDLALQGEEIVGFMLNGPSESFRWMVSSSSMQASMLHTARGLLFECEQFAEGDLMWDEAVNLANRIVATMSSVRQKPLWDGVKRARCYAEFTPVQRDWIELFAATGARDAKTMAQTGARMIAGDAAKTPRQWAYLVTATAAALLAGGDPVAARAIIVRNWKHLDQATRDWPTMELLLRVALPQ
jgi:predicted membrane-bound spermidine synthase